MKALPPSTFGAGNTCRRGSVKHKRNKKCNFSFRSFDMVMFMLRDDEWKGGQIRRSVRGEAYKPAMVYTKTKSEEGRFRLPNKHWIRC